jgi:hypothetical protein
MEAVDMSTSPLKRPALAVSTAMRGILRKGFEDKGRGQANERNG